MFIERTCSILAKRREQRLATAWKLSALGWTQAEIGQMVGTSQDSISLDLRKTSDLKKLVNSALSSGLPVSEVAKRFNLPPLLVLAASLEAKGDPARAYSPKAGGLQHIVPIAI
ncbi:MAG: hypothetical protein HYY01_11205 [Chloroflexi bacterium]|nr:hypothetical protein [Chloroflexota bacterium]